MKKNLYFTGLSLAFLFYTMQISNAQDVNDTDTLNQALTVPSGSVNLNILGNIDLTNNLNNYTFENLTINGKGLKINGQGLYSGFIIDDTNLSNGIVNINDGMTFENFYYDLSNHAAVISNEVGKAKDEATVRIGNDVGFFNNKGGQGALFNSAFNATTTPITATTIVGDNAVFSENKGKYGVAIHNYTQSSQADTNAKIIIGDNAKFTYNVGEVGIIYNKAEGKTIYGTIDIGKNAIISNNTINHTGASGTEVFGAVFNNVSTTTNTGDIALASITIGDNAKISSNSFLNKGSAILNSAYVTSSAQTMANITIGDNVEFSQNSGGWLAGGLVNTAISYKKLDATITIGDNVIFCQNKGDSGGAIAGQVMSYLGKATSQMTIGKNAIFSQNSATGDGGAIYNLIRGDSSSDTTSVIDIEDNATFSGNTAKGHGGAIYNFTQTAENQSVINLNGSALFKDNKDSSGLNDIYLAGTKATLNIVGHEGAVIFESGLANSDQDAVINKTGNNTLILGTSDEGVNSQFQTFTGNFNQSAGTTFAYADFLGGINNLANSNAYLVSNAPNVKLGSEFNLLGDNNINTINGTTTNYAATDAIRVLGVNNFNIDVVLSKDGTTAVSDNFYAPLFESLEEQSESAGVLNVSGINIQGTPTAEVIPLQIFSYDVNDPVAFEQSVGKIQTPVYEYDLSANYGQPGGTYALLRGAVNPQAHRGQVSTLAMYSGQLSMINTLFDHVYLDSPDFAPQKMQNKQPSGDTASFAPYQFSQDNGGFWFKSYGSFGDISLTNGYDDIDNNIYGSIFGVDLLPVELSDGWKFLPTVFASYNGGHQNYNGVKMDQNGGQAGFMGTFFKQDFTTSILAYAGGYNNKMKVQGYEDDTNNWFAGTTLKAAYNFDAAEHVILQPSMLVGYNAFGKQTWHSDFGSLSMSSDALNGVNMAPGLNIIYAEKNWTTYFTTLYNFNFNEQIGGRAGNADLPSLKMKHDWIEYGIGGTKTLDDKWILWGQTTFRNGGRTDAGLQLGFSLKF